MYLYTCEQRKRLDGTVECTDVTLDENTTIIDGGNIITHTVTAEQLNATSINASKTLTVGAMTDAAAATILNSNISVGGRNYILDSAGTLVSCLGSAAGSRKEYQSLNVGQSYMNVPDGTEVTISFDLYMTVNTANPRLQVYNTNNKGPKQFMAVSKYFTAAVGDVINERVSLTSSIRDRADSTLSNNFIEFYSYYDTSNWFSISNLKVEIGNVATDWTPAPEDMASSADSVEFISGTQTAATNAWTGVTKDASLSTGKMIAYYLPYAGTSSAATLNLTFSGGGTTGAKNVKYNNNNSAANNVTTHYGAGSIIYMTYDGTYWRVAASYYDTGGITNARYRTQNPNAIKAAEAIIASHIICGTSSGYKNIAAGVTFDLSYPLLYATSAIASGSTGTDNYLTYNGVNVTNNGSITGATSNAMVFLKGTVSGNTFTIAASGYMTCTVPTSEDGYAYIPLGILYNGTNGIYFSTSKDLYAYKDGAFGPVSIREASAAAKTATSYVTDITGGGIMVHPSTDATTGVQITDDVDILRDGTSVINIGDDDAIRIGASGNVQMHLESDGMSIDNENGDEIFAIDSSTTGSVTVPLDVSLVTWNTTADVDGDPHGFNDDGATVGTTTVVATINESEYPLNSTYATATVTAGTGVSVTLTSAGVTYVQGLMVEESEGDGGTVTTTYPCELSVEYQHAVTDIALLSLIGGQTVLGEGNALYIANTRWLADTRQTGTLLRIRNATTGREIKLGVSSNGYTRGLWDSNKNDWIVARNKDNKTVINGPNFSVSSGGTVNASGTIASWYQVSAKGNGNTAATKRIVALRSNSAGNRGLYDVSLDKWIFYKRPDGQVVIADPLYQLSNRETTCPITTANATLISNVNYFWYNGAACSVTIGVNLKSALGANSSVEVAKVPEGFAPPHGVMGQVYITGITTAPPLFAQLTTTRAIQLNNKSGSSIGTSANIYISFTYVP